MIPFISHKSLLPRRLAVHRVLCPSTSIERQVEGQNVTGDAPAKGMTVGFNMRRFKNLAEIQKRATDRLGVYTMEIYAVLMAITVDRGGKA